MFLPSWWLVLLLLLGNQAREGDASLWSSSSSSSQEIEKDDDTTTTSDNLLVSPILNREIDVSVQAPWPSSPYNVLCECHAYLKRWEFLESLAQNVEVPNLDTFEEATRVCLETWAQQLQQQNHLLLKLALVTRSQSPTCEMHRGLAQQYKDKLVSGSDDKNSSPKNAFAVVLVGHSNNNKDEEEGRVVTDPTMLPDTLEPLSDEERTHYLLPGEVPRPPNNYTNNENAEGLVLLYANLGTREFSAFYQALVEKGFPFVVRHLGVQDDEEEESASASSYATTTLQGYGVRLDIRNVEYKVFDDTKKKDDSTSNDMVNVTQTVGAAAELNQNTFLAGVNWTALGMKTGGGGDEKNMSLYEDLWKLHHAQERHAQMIPPTWQRRQLSLQAATVIVASGIGNQLLTLQEVSQNLPSVASTLVHVDVPEEIETVAEPMERALHRMILESGGGLWINGRPIMISRPSFSVFDMIRRFQEEQDALDQLSRNLGPYFGKKENSQAALELVYEAWIQGDEFLLGKDDGDDNDNDDDGGSDAAAKGGNKLVRINVEAGETGAVIYLNDIEKDPQYAHYPTQVQQMIMAMQYGMPPAIRRNIFTLLAVDDPFQMKINLGSQLVAQLLQGQFPIRYAMLIVDDDDVKSCEDWVRETQPDEGVPCPNPKKDHWLDGKQAPALRQLKDTKATARDLHQLYSYVKEKFASQPGLMLAYMQYIPMGIIQSEPSIGDLFSVYDLIEVHNMILMQFQLLSRPEAPVEVAKGMMDVDEDDTGASYFKGVRFAVDKGLKVGMSFLNGRALPDGSGEDMDDEQERLGGMFMEEQEFVFGMVMSGEITDSSPRNFYKKLLSGTKTSKPKNVYPRVHPLFSAPPEYVDLQHHLGPSSLLVAENGGAALTKDAVVVVEAVLELDTAKGRTIAKHFLEVMETVTASLEDLSVAYAYRILPSTIEAAESPVCKILVSAGNMGRSGIIKALENAGEPSTDQESNPCLGLPYLGTELPSENFLVVGGRVFNIEGSSIGMVDIELLVSAEMDLHVATTKMLKDYVDTDRPYEGIARATAILAKEKSGSTKRSNPVDMILSFEKRLQISNNPLRFSWNDDCSGDEGLKMSVTAVVDPVTETAQRLSPLLQIIRDELKLPLTLVLAPTTVLDGDSKIPISSYYRFVLDPSAYQGSANPPKAYFSNLPHDHVLTVRMDVPEPWDIQQRKAIQDTDNLRCDLHSGCSDDAAIGKNTEGVPLYKQRHVTSVEYGLNHLLFFGRCYEVRQMSPPNGLQLTLSPHGYFDTSEKEQVEINPDGSIVTSTDSVGENAVHSYYSDTVVMKTKGYWQLRANPGVWDLNFLKNSRGEEIFDMVEGEIRRGVPKVTGKNKNHNSKKLVMVDFVTQSSTLLVQHKPGHEKDTLFSNTKAVTTADDTVHVFSLATGHLYERFLKIMMLSVTKRTSSKVKFWLFENFLSPTFKASATAMAQRIGCEVEFVTYKWPEWLRGQTEKQRIIWGYKILFLDVLFPLNVKKIIYVDADQVIRGDLKELWDMDLGDAPYGYTPMCSSREETLGFAFWRTGFWENHLRGRPYHISALYVVDLERFRKTLVGDTLRATYQQLSADPNSLANLDQDLPNFAQHQVPIFSLPQEWLWCESWCSDETKRDAKTIDLCNNPLHKEPKVSMAKRIISGELFEESWVELDAEVEGYEAEYFSSI